MTPLGGSLGLGEQGRASPDRLTHRPSIAADRRSASPIREEGIRRGYRDRSLSFRNQGQSRPLLDPRARTASPTPMGQEALNLLALSTRLSGKIEEMINFIENGGNNPNFNYKNHRNTNITQILYVGNDAVNLASAELNFFVNKSNGQAVILSEDHVRLNSVNGCRLEYKHEAPQAGQMYRVCKKRTGTVVYKPVTRSMESLGFITK